MLRGSKWEKLWEWDFSLVAAKAVEHVILRLSNTVTRRSGLTMMFILTERSLRVALLNPPWLNKSTNYKIKLFSDLLLLFSVSI